MSKTRSRRAAWRQKQQDRWSRNEDALTSAIRQGVAEKAQIRLLCQPSRRALAGSPA